MQGPQFLNFNLLRLGAGFDHFQNVLARGRFALSGCWQWTIDGEVVCTGDQQFFIAFGQNYASKPREAALRRQVLTDPHSPGQYRADTVRNIDGWYGSFDVQPGQKLYLSPPDRVRIC